MRFFKFQSLGFYCWNFINDWNKFHQDTKFLRSIKGNKLLDDVEKTGDSSGSPVKITAAKYTIIFNILVLIAYTFLQHSP